jgi:hypothetical protein
LLGWFKFGVVVGMAVLAGEFEEFGAGFASCATCAIVLNAAAAINSANLWRALRIP